MFTFTLKKKIFENAVRNGFVKVPRICSNHLAVFLSTYDYYDRNTQTYEYNKPLLCRIKCFGKDEYANAKISYYKHLKHYAEEADGFLIFLIVE